MQLRAEVNNSISSLRENLTSLNDAMRNFSITISNVNKGLQEHKKQTETELADLQTSLASTQANHTNFLNIKIDSLEQCLSEHKEQVTGKLNALQTSQANHTSQLKEALNASLSLHNQQITTELTLLQTSLNSTHSKLDSLTATNAQLSSDHQQIQANISEVECLDTEQSLELHQNMYDNLTHQLEKIQDDVTLIHEQYWCGGTGGWRRVVYLDMTDPSTTCPSGWQLTGYSERTCGRATDGTYTCNSATFPVGGEEYTRICGRIRAYQYASPDAFQNYHNGPATITIDDAYVDGVSVTHGTPRNHIWTFAAGLSENDAGFPSNVCPCDASIDIRVPSFVGEDYFCESGLHEPWTGASSQYKIYSNDTLWDGEDCLPSSTCCSRRNPPYFVKQLSTSITDDIEARTCANQGLSNENVAVELVELYVQ